MSKLHASEISPLPRRRDALRSQDSDLPRLLTVDEVASLLRTTKKAVYTMVERRQLPGLLRLGRRVLFSQAALVTWLTEKGGTPSPDGDRR